MNPDLSTGQIQHVQELVEHYKKHIPLIRGFLNSFECHFKETFSAEGQLSNIVHSVKSRMKDPEHLRDKLYRKIHEANIAGLAYEVTCSNLFTKINDLGGYRILHLHTSQAAAIHPVLLDVIDLAQFDLFEDPVANVWDEEAKTLFDKIGVGTKLNPRMYSSVHYVIRARAKVEVTCEVQVRTLADEIWGEIDHRINYPEQHPSLGCREQIKVLARVASSCSRLVDSIMVAHDEWNLHDSEDSPQTTSP